MKRFIRILTAGALLSGAACGETPLGLEGTAVLADRATPAAVSVSALTQNLYVGADVDAVIGALASPDPTDDLPALFSAIQTFQETDYVARLNAVADAIARSRPHAVGLQEVSVLDIDLTGLGVPVVVHADFLPTLTAALADRGLHYSVAATVENIEASPVPGIRLIDYDALLVDATRVTVQDAGGQNFAVNLGVVAPGVELKRGWVWASTIIDGKPYFFASTHLEGSAPGMPELLAAQASELAGFVPTDVPVIALGDFNDKPGSLMYRAMTASGFTDAWRDLRPGVVGFTCCHLSDLTDHVADLTQRIDYVFTRGVGTARTGLQGNIGLTGEVPADRIAGPSHAIWPSDHGGLLVNLLN